MVPHSSPTVVVIGNSMVGYKFCEELLAKSTAFNLVVFGEEPRVAYDRVHLSEYLLQTVNNKIVWPPHPEDLILGDRGGEAEAGAGPMSLPDEALVCSCEAITKGVICDAVTEQHGTTVDGMKKCNKAGTGCGGCVPMVKDLINGTLTAQGAYIKNVLCEHFDYSRQELFDLLRRTFSLLTGECLNGDECSIRTYPIKVEGDDVYIGLKG